MKSSHPIHKVPKKMGLLECTETHPHAELAEMPKNYTYVLLRTLLPFIAKISKLHQRTIPNSQNRSSMEIAPTLGSRLGKQYSICFERNYSGFRYYEKYNRGWFCKQKPCCSYSPTQISIKKKTRVLWKPNNNQTQEDKDSDYLIKKLSPVL